MVARRPASPVVHLFQLAVKGEVKMSLSRKQFVMLLTGGASCVLSAAPLSLLTQYEQSSSDSKLSNLKKKIEDINSNRQKLKNIISKYDNKKIESRFFTRYDDLELLYKTSSSYGRYANFDISKEIDCLQLISTGIVGRNYQLNAKINLEVFSSLTSCFEDKCTVFECGTHYYNKYLSKKNPYKGYLIDDVSYKAQHFYLNTDGISFGDRVELLNLGKDIQDQALFVENYALKMLSDEVQIGSFKEFIIPFLSANKS